MPNKKNLCSHLPNCSPLEHRHDSGTAPDAADKPRQMSLARKAGIYTVSRAVTILAQIGALAILSRALPKETTYAQLQFLLLVYGTAQVFGQLGLPDSIFYFFEKYPSEQRRSIVRFVSKILMWTALFSAALFLGIGLFGTADAAYAGARPLLWMFMALLVLELPTLPVPNVLIALDKARAAAWFNIFVGVTQFLALTLPLLSAEPLYGISIGLLSYGVLRLAVSAAIYFLHMGAYPRIPLPAGFLRELLYYSVPLSLAQLFWTLNRQIDKYVVKEFLPADTFAEYSNGAWELPIIPTIAYSVAAVMMPQMVAHFLKHENRALLELWLRGIKKVTVIVLPLVFVFLLGAEEFMVLLYSEKYRNSALPFSIYTLILLQRVASYSNMLKALNDTRAVTYSAIYLFAINALLAVPFVLWLGVAGPPLASLIAQTFAWWYSLHVISKLLGVRFSETFPFGFYGKTLLVAIVAAAPFYFLKNHWGLQPVLAFPVMAIGFLCLYFLLARASNIITRADAQRILKNITPSFFRR